MKTARLLAEFTRARQDAPGWAVDVMKITWPHPSRPESIWTTTARLPAEATEEEIENARRALLKDPRFFRVCHRCRQRQPCGWMLSENLCQGCSEAVF